MLQPAAPPLVNAEPGSFSGPPGTSWVNDTSKVLFQAHVSFHNSCARCIQRAGRIGPWFPFPSHPGCVCWQTPVPPGATSRPFTDYITEMEKLTPAQQTNAMGKSNWRLIQSGAVQWEDVVTRGRIRPLHEVVARQKLSVADLVKAGVSRHNATVAHGIAFGEKKALADSARQAAVAKLKALGVTDDQIRAAVRERLKARLGIKAEPLAVKGKFDKPQPPPPPSEPKPAPKPKGPKPKPAPVPKAAPKPPEFGTSKAKVRVLDPDAAFTVEDAVKAAGKMVGKKLTTADLASLAGATQEATVNVANVEPGRVRLYVTGDDYDADRVLRLSRDGRPIIENVSFYVDPERLGQGLGSQVFGRQVEQAARLGFAEIHTDAAGRKGTDSNGYYTWPRFGYDGPIPDAERANLPPDLAGAIRLSDLMQTPEGRAWWKDNGRGVAVTFDLAEGSLSRRIWDDYRAAKAAKP